MVPLGEVARVVSGATPKSYQKEFWDGDIPWITPADLTGHNGIYFRGTTRRITEAGYKNCSTELLPVGSILFSSRAPIGHCAVNSYPICTNQGFKSLIPKKNLDSIFCFFALKFFTPEIIRLGRGATFLEVNKEIIEEFRIPLPSLEIQRRIANVLERADRMRRLRQHALEMSDTYLQSVFLEMFGDVNRNTKKMEISSVGDVCLVVTDGTHQPPVFTESGVPFVFVKDIVHGFIDFSDTRFVSEQTYAELTKNIRPEINDIVYSSVGVSLGHAVKVSTNRKFTFQRHIALLRPNPKIINPTFFCAQLNSHNVYSQAISLSRGAAQPTINLKEIKELRLLLPPLELQEKFARIVQTHEHLRAQQLEAHRQAQHLYDTLLHQAFTGQLNTHPEPRALQASLF
jgi:type I restriction enzyme, S subunit